MLLVLHPCGERRRGGGIRIRKKKTGGSQEDAISIDEIEICTAAVILLAARREIALHHPYSAVPAWPWVHVLSVTNAMGIDVDFNINQAPSRSVIYWIRRAIKPTELCSSPRTKMSQITAALFVVF